MAQRMRILLKANYRETHKVGSIFEAVEADGGDLEDAAVSSRMAAASP